MNDSEIVDAVTHKLCGLKEGQPVRVMGTYDGFITAFDPETTLYTVTYAQETSFGMFYRSELEEKR